MFPVQGQPGPRGIAGKDGDDGEGGQPGDPGELGPSGNPVSHCYIRLQSLQYTCSAFYSCISSRTSNLVWHVSVYMILFSL